MAVSPRILVTGATGFVGRALVSELATRGCTVRAAVRSTTPAATGAAEHVAIGDLSAATDWRNAVADCDAVIHLAGRAHVLKESGDPTPLFRAINRDAAVALGHAARDAGVRRMVFVSSIGVHGLASPAAGFSAESPIAPSTPYAISKAEAEAGLAAIDGLDLAIVRPPLVYGPEAKGNFARLVKLVESGLPLPLGRARNRRSLIGLANLVDFLALCVDHPGAANRAFVIADAEITSTAELVRAIGRIRGKRVPLLPVPVAPMIWAARALGRGALADGLFGDLVVNAAAARERLGWTPRFTQAELLAAALQA